MEADPRLKLFPNQPQDRRPLLFLHLLDKGESIQGDEDLTGEFKTFFSDWKKFIAQNNSKLNDIPQTPAVGIFGNYDVNGVFTFDPKKIQAVTDQVFPGLYKSSQVSDADSGATAFSAYKFDSYIRKRLFDIANADIENPPDMDIDKPYAEVPGTAKNIIDYDTGFTKNGIPYDRNDKLTEGVFSMGAKCYGTGLTLDDADCKDLMNALISDDVTLIDRFLEKAKNIPDFGKVAADEIVNMHPVLALRMLQKFGFKKTKEYDPVAGTELWKVDNVKHWLKNYMSERFSSDEIKKMLTQPGQNYILEYLDLVADFVNQNPAILNRGYSGVTSQKTGTFNRTEYAERLGIVPELPRKFTMNASNLKRLDSYFKSQVFAQQRPFSSGLNMSTTSYFPGQYFVGGGSPFARNGSMSGGGSGKCASIYRRLGANNGITAGQMISNAVDDLRKELKARGQQLSSTDNKNLDDRIKQYITLEDSLLKTVCMVEEYLNWTSVGHAFDSRPSILQENNLAKMNERMQKLYDRKGNDDRKFNEILIRITEALEDKGGKYHDIYSGNY